MKLCLFLLSLSQVVSSISTKKNSPVTVVLPDTSRIVGAVDEISDSVLAFRGIPFAVPPVGDLRFRSPQKYVPTPNQSIDASEFGNICMQNGDIPCSEDCLFLNVFSNVKQTKPLVPVAIWVYGGSYVNGASDLYPGGEFIDYTNGEMILITLNYRLNVFGFLGGEELRQLNDDKSTGNAGIQDQRLAFQWVQDNIAAFGGDPNQVTIFGESAGAGSMSSHLTMQKSFGLYNQVILESGTASQWTAQPMEVTQNIFEQVKAGVGCADVQCLTTTKAEDFLTLTLTPVGNYIGFGPTADGVEVSSQINIASSTTKLTHHTQLDTHPWIKFKNGEGNDVKILHGTNTDEGRSFVPLQPNATEADLLQLWSAVGGFTDDDLANLHKIYVDNPEEPYPEVEGYSVFFWGGMRSYGDISFSCPAKFVSQTLSDDENHKSDIFTYHFEHHKNNEDFVVHASEIEYVFHAPMIRSADSKVGDYMTESWKNFIVGGNPGEEWTKYDSVNDELLRISLNSGEENVIKSGLKLDACNLLIPAIDRTLEEDFA